jgi:N-acetylglucosamine-6-phosphate deacetylase
VSTLGILAPTVALPDRLACPGGVLVDTGSGIVLDAGEPSVTRGAERTVDVAPCIVVPGFVDMHVHGGGGAEVNGSSADEVAEAVRSVARFHAAHGTTSIVATTIADAPGRLQAAVAGIAAVSLEQLSGGRGGRGESGKQRARVLGSHLEGPFISRARCGAQDPTALRLPDLAELEALLDAAAGTLRIITVAPELEGALELIERARLAGVLVSLGHSDADLETARRGFEAGARHVTHLFNAMAPLHHRHPGLVGEALLRSDVTLELVADLHHLHPAVLALAWRVAGDRIVAVTDAIAAAGLADGSHAIGHRKITVDGGRVTLADDPQVLAGSALTMDGALRNLHRAAGLPLRDAIAAVSLTPARALGITPAGIVAGAKADLAVLDTELLPVATLVGARAVYDRDRRFRAEPGL